MSSMYDVIIIGGGAAGLSAALYSCRAMLKTLVIEQLGCGGQILVTDLIENYPGFPEGIKGPDLAKLFEEHASKYGTKIVYEQITDVRLDPDIKIVNTTVKPIIIKSGQGALLNFFFIFMFIFTIILLFISKHGRLWRNYATLQVSLSPDAAFLFFS